MQDIKERFLEVGLGIAPSIGCLLRCNPHILSLLSVQVRMRRFFTKAAFRLIQRRLRRASRTARARHPYLGNTMGASAIIIDLGLETYHFLYGSGGELAVHAGDEGGGDTCGADGFAGVVV